MNRRRTASFSTWRTPANTLLIEEFDRPRLRRG
jgi:hypothetical protein